MSDAAGSAARCPWFTAGLARRFERAFWSIQSRGWGPTRSRTKAWHPTSTNWSHGCARPCPRVRPLLTSAAGRATTLALAASGVRGFGTEVDVSEPDYATTRAFAKARSGRSTFRQLMPPLPADDP